MQEIFNRTYSDISNWKSDLKKYKEETNYVYKPTQEQKKRMGENGIPK